MIYGYARVSTLGQEVRGNSLEGQIKELENAGARKIFSDAYTGMTLDRPNFKKLLGLIEEGDTLIVTKLDRVARSLTEGSRLINDLIERNIRVHILNIGIMDNTPSSKLIRNIFFAFAEFERDLIVERTQAGKEIARQNPNFREGRPKKYTRDQVAHALGLLSVNGGDYSYNQVSNLTGISKSTLIRRQKDLKKSPRA